MAEARNARRERKSLLDIQNSVLRGCNFLLSAFRRESGTSMLKAYFCKEEASLYLPRLFMNMVLKRMEKGEEYQCMNIMFRFLAMFIDRATGILRDALMTVVNTKYP